MFISMETDKDIGGVCGYMGLKPERNMDEAGHYIDGYDPDKNDSLSNFCTKLFLFSKPRSLNIILLILSTSRLNLLLGLYMCCQVLSLGTDINP